MRRRSVVASGWMMLVGLLLALTAGEVRGQAGDTEGGAAPIEEVVQAEAADLQAVASDPLPAPDYRRAYWHVFLAFAAAWVLLIGYAIHIDRRVIAASETLARLERRG